METLSLFEKLAEDVAQWRKNGYACADYPLIGEILSFQMEVAGDPADHPILKFLCEPQFLALEVYWYVRLKLATPHILDMYKHYYGDDNKALFDALRYADVDTIIGDIKTDLNFVREKKIQTLHEKPPFWHIRVISSP